MKIVEPFAVPDTFVAELGRVDIMRGGFARFVLCVDRTGADGTPELHVAAKIVMPVSAVPDAILQATKATALAAIGTAEAVYN